MKTLSDTRAAYVDLIPRAATIEDLISLDPPLWGTRAPRSSVELMTVQVAADVVAFKLEADRDFHIVLRGRSGETMIAELPPPSCVRGSRFEAEIRFARAAFLRLFGWPRKSLTALETPVSVRVTDVLFFDKLHGQMLAADGAGPDSLKLSLRLRFLGAAGRSLFGLVDSPH